jgi:hypothetical protein
LSGGGEAELAKVVDGSADLDGDGDITLDEFYSHVYDRGRVDRRRLGTRRRRSVSWSPAPPARGEKWVRARPAAGC